MLDRNREKVLKFFTQSKASTKGYNKILKYKYRQMVQQYVKGNVQKDKQIGKFNKRTRQITSHTTLSLRTQESGKGLRNQHCPKETEGRKVPTGHVSAPFSILPVIL